MINELTQTLYLAFFWLSTSRENSRHFIWLFFGCQRSTLNGVTKTNGEGGLATLPTLGPTLCGLFVAAVSVAAVAVAVVGCHINNVYASLDLPRVNKQSRMRQSSQRSCVPAALRDL